MKKFLASDNALKLISVVIAIIIWMYITIVMDPSIELSVRDLPIQFVGQDNLASKGLSVINESDKKINIKVKGNRKRMGNNDMNSIIVKVDESNISETGVHSLPVEVIIPFENQGISSQSIYTVDVFVEELAQKTLDVDINKSGALAQNYASGDAIAEPKSVTIKGPKSAIEKIGKACVNLVFNGEDVDIDKELPLDFLGADGKEISSLDAILTRVSVSSQKIKIHCPVLKIRTVVPIINFGGQTLPDGYSYSIEPKELYIYSDNPNVLKSAVISTDEVWIDKLVENKKIKVKLRIPDGVKVLYDIREVEISIKED